MAESRERPKQRGGIFKRLKNIGGSSDEAVAGSSTKESFFRRFKRNIKKSLSIRKLKQETRESGSEDASSSSEDEEPITLSTRKALAKHHFETEDFRRLMGMIDKYRTPSVDKRGNETRPALPPTTVNELKAEILVAACKANDTAFLNEANFTSDVCKLALDIAEKNQDPKLIAMLYQNIVEQQGKSQQHTETSYIPWKGLVERAHKLTNEISHEAMINRQLALSPNPDKVADGRNEKKSCHDISRQLSLQTIKIGDYTLTQEDAERLYNPANTPPENPEYLRALLTTHLQLEKNPSQVEYLMNALNQDCVFPLAQQVSQEVLAARNIDGTQNHGNTIPNAGFPDREIAGQKKGSMQINYDHERQEIKIEGSSPVTGFRTNMRQVAPIPCDAEMMVRLKIKAPAKEGGEAPEVGDFKPEVSRLEIREKGTQPFKHFMESHIEEKAKKHVAEMATAADMEQHRQGGAGMGC
jgi:hypothetical protein